MAAVPNAFLSIRKPAGMTSRDVVNRIVRTIGVSRVGHAGTLDPMATGVLVVAIGRATRLVEYVQRMPKTYAAQFRLGVTSDTDDVQGKIISIIGAAAPDESSIRDALTSFVGEIQQLPPRFSALKVKGRRAYELAREGVRPDLEPRPVHVHEIELVRYSHPTLTLRIDCGSGTYVRAIGRDLGRALGVGAIMTELERTAIGSFRLEDSTPLDRIEPRNWQDHARPVLDALTLLPAVTLEASEVVRFEQGQPIILTQEPVHEVVVLATDQSLLGIGRVSTGGLLRATKAGFRPNHQ